MKEWNHILYEDKTGDGHLPHYGWRNDRTTPFPADWTPARIARMIAEHLPAAYTQAAGKEDPVDIPVEGLGTVRFVFKTHDGALRLASCFPYEERS